MDWYRLWHTLRMYLTLNAFKRAEYLEKHHIFRHVGKNCMVMFRKIPLHANLISFQDNVRVASNVLFVTHDVAFSMLNEKYKTDRFKEYKDCIDVRENVFIGANTTILPGVRIGPDVIIGAGSLVNKDIRDGVYAGVPARYICSIEDFVAKRDRLEKEKSAIKKTGSVDECWEWFEAQRMGQNRARPSQL